MRGASCQSAMPPSHDVGALARPRCKRVELLPALSHAAVGIWGVGGAYTIKQRRPLPFPARPRYLPVEVGEGAHGGGAHDRIAVDAVPTLVVLGREDDTRVLGGALEEEVTASRKSPQVR